MTGHFVVALGGGIASGKSAAAIRFVQLGAGVYDADVAAREVVRQGEPAYAAIVDHFGESVRNTDGGLNRHILRERVFADPAQRKMLEAIVHPRVRAWLRDRVAQDSNAYCVLLIPLLAETWPQYAWVDRVAMIDVPREVQVERLLLRDGVTLQLAEAMLAAQATRERRLALAQDVLDNSGTMAQLHAQVDALDTRYRALAQVKLTGHKS